jgi:hypothetical protein
LNPFLRSIHRIIFSFRYQWIPYARPRERAGEDHSKSARGSQRQARVSSADMNEKKDYRARGKRVLTVKSSRKVVQFDVKFWRASESSGTIAIFKREGPFAMDISGSNS